MTIDIEIECDDWLALIGLEELAVKVSGAALAGRGDPGDIYLLFTSDADIRVMNRDWRGQDKATNVLSFPAVDIPLPAGERLALGDVVLAFETVAREAVDQGKTLTNHTAHLIIHGILHLLGYDHVTDPEADAMEGEERRILAGLGIADPYET